MKKVCQFVMLRSRKKIHWRIMLTSVLLCVNLILCHAHTPFIEQMESMLFDGSILSSWLFRFLFDFPAFHWVYKYLFSLTSYLVKVITTFKPLTAHKTHFRINERLKWKNITFLGSFTLRKILKFGTSSNKLLHIFFSQLMNIFNYRK